MNQSSHLNTEPTVESISEQASSATHSAKEKIMEASAQAKEKLAEKGTQLVEKADETLNNVGERVHDLADTVRKNAPAEGKIGHQMGKVADGLDSSADYLTDHNLNEIQADVTNLIRKYPKQSLAAGFLLGFLMGAALSRR